MSSKVATHVGMTTKTGRRYNPICATIEFHLKHCPRHRSASNEPVARSSQVKKTPKQFPDPWLFDSEKLLRELDRCREMVLLIPATTHETHFACNNAISAIWNLREQLRYLLGLHRDAQQAFAKKTVSDYPNNHDRPHRKNRTPRPDIRLAQPRVISG